MSSINFYPAARSDVNLIVELTLGAPDQITTRVGLKLFDLKNLGQAKRLFGAMARSNESWRATTLAESDGNVIAMLQSNAPSMALSARLAITAVLLYERAGFKIVETCTDEGFKELAGAEGNHLMVKGLSPANGTANY